MSKVSCSSAWAALVMAVVVDVRSAHAANAVEDRGGNSVTASAPFADDAPSTESKSRTLGAHRHDGLYLRASFGYAGMHDSVVVPRSASGSSSDATFYGGFSDEVLVGGTLSRFAGGPGSLVIGGGLTAFSSKGATTVSFDGAPTHSVTTGAGVAFADYYFDAQRGWHVQSLVGPAIASGECDRCFPGFAVGVLAGVGVGYDFWVGEQFSLGAAGRVLYLHAVGLDVGDQHDVLATTLAVSVLYN